MVSRSNLPNPLASALLTVSVLAGCSHPEQPAEFTNSIGMQLVRISPGEFLMGSAEPHPLTEETQPQHRVRITKPFYLAAHEVTQEQYVRMLGTGFSDIHFSATGAGKPTVEGIDTSRFPADRVSSGEARAFCEALPALPTEVEAGGVYRLPTEAEWEYACRGGTQTLFSCGDRLTPTDANIHARPGAESGARPLRRTTTVILKKNYFLRRQ